MKSKDLVLKIFEQNRGKFVSGEELAKKIGVSRNSVWKAVRALNEAGFGIFAVKNKGYMLKEDTDMLTAQGIEKYLNSNSFYDLHVEKCVSSTNTVAKELATQGAREGVVVVAEEQTAGRGRLGRKFYSPSGCGVYFSIILRPKQNFEQALFLTVMAAVAVADGIIEVSGENAQIKWVNDVYINGKKCSGILTEAVTDMESGGIEYLVVGIGINCKQPNGGFADEIKNIACAVCGDCIKDARNRIVASVLNQFFSLYANFNKQDIYDKYKSKSFLIGQKVMVVKNDSEQEATAVDIDENCRLIVEYGDHTQEILSTGEVRVTPC